MINYCVYCGEPRGEKYACCSEAHFEECTELEYEHMQGTGKTLDETRSSFDAFVEAHQHLLGDPE